MWGDRIDGQPISHDNQIDFQKTRYEQKHHDDENAFQKGQTTFEDENLP